MFSQAFRVLALLWLAACSCRCVLRVPRLFARLQIATLVPVSFALPTVAVAFAQRLVGSPPLAPVLKQVERQVVAQPLAQQPELAHWWAVTQVYRSVHDPMLLLAETPLAQAWTPLH